MPSVPSEPEKYSIDEMMERLKSIPSAESDAAGERVVRADGSEAIKVRKRKRRSEQPKKEIQKQTRRARILQVVASTILIVLALLAAGSALAYSNSPAFREGLLKKILTSTGGTPEIGTFRMNPRTANAGRLNLQWPKGNVIDTLSTTGLTAEIDPSSFLGKAMTGEEITVTNASLKLQLPDLDQPLVTPSRSEAGVPISFKRYRTPKFDMTYGTPAVISLSQSEASLYPNSTSSRLQFSLKGGALTLPGWPKLDLDRAFMEFRGKEIDIVSINLIDPSGRDGTFEFAGTLSPYSPDRPSSLSVEIKDYPVSSILGPDFDKLFIGNIDSVSSTKSNFYSFYPSAKPAQKLSIAFRKNLASVFEVSKFPFLFSLARTLEDQWFQQPSFLGEDASATIIREKGTVTIQDINFQSKGRLALRGSVSLSRTKALSGELEVGVAENMIVSAENSPRLKTLFGPVRDGYCWLTINISGTAANPQDDFKDLFLATPVTKPKDGAESDYEGSTFEELTKPRE